MRVRCFLTIFVASATVHAHGSAHERIAQLTKLLRAHPTARLHLERGEVLRAHGDWREALADYEKAARLDPKLAETDLCRGRALLDGGKLDWARDSLDRYVKRRPAAAAGYLYRARTLARLGEPLAAAQDYTRLIARVKAPKPEYYLERARLLAGAGGAHVDQALRGLDEGLARLGPVVTLESAAVEIEVDAGHWDAALARVDRIVARLDRKEAWTLRRAGILERAGRGKAARSAYADALRMIEALPERLRRTRATGELERRARAALERVPGGQGRAASCLEKE